MLVLVSELRGGAGQSGVSPCSCAELCRAAPLSACPSHLSAVAAVGSSVLNSDQGFYNYTIRSIHCLVESKLEERNVMDTYFAFWIVCRYFLGCVLSSLRTEGNYSSPFSALFALVWKKMDCIPASTPETAGAPVRGKSPTHCVRAATARRGAGRTTIFCCVPALSSSLVVSGGERGRGGQPQFAASSGSGLPLPPWFSPDTGSCRLLLLHACLTSVAF